MSIVTGMLVKSKDDLKYTDTSVLEALNNSLGDTLELPITYLPRYTGEPVFPTEENVLGEVKSLYKNDGHLYCNAEIFDMMNIAMNFEGCFDNIVAGYNKETEKFEIVSFIVYSLEYKQEKKKRLDKMRENATKVDLPKPGEIPIMHDSGISFNEEEFRENIRASLREHLENSEIVDRIKKQIKEFADGKEVTNMCDNRNETNEEMSIAMEIGGIESIPNIQYPTQTVPIVKDED